MRRHQVMDLFHGNETNIDEGTWNEIQKGKPNHKTCKVKLRLKNGDEVFAYFYKDGGLQGHLYSEKERPYFWHCQTKDYIPNHDITHWILAKEPKS